MIVQSEIELRLSDSALRFLCRSWGDGLYSADLYRGGALFHDDWEVMPDFYFLADIRVILDKR